MFKYFRLSLGARLALGTFLVYSSYETYMYICTQNLIEKRKRSIKSLSNSDGYDGFRSAKIGGVFVNPFEEYRPQTAFEFLYVRLFELFEGDSENKNQGYSSSHCSDIGSGEMRFASEKHEPNYKLLKENTQKFRNCMSSGDFRPLEQANSGEVPLNQQLLFTWLGQSCTLIQLGGINILTDPIFSDHLFANKIGPKRLISSPMSVQDVKYATNDELSLVLVSHNHPDHLDMAAAQKIGDSALWVVPLGLKQVLEKKGINNVIEMDWWDSISLNKYLFNKSEWSLPNEYELTFLPAMHWSGTHIIDANTSLWGSFLIRQNGKSVIYHAGDTGYSEQLFEKIGQNYGPVYLSLLPIGQYCPSWHQKPRHTSPDECFKIASSMKSRNMMGIHFGTFKLSSEPTWEPKTLFLKLSEHQDKVGFYNVPVFGLTYQYDISSSRPPSITYTSGNSPIL